MRIDTKLEGFIRMDDATDVVLAARAEHSLPLVVETKDKGRFNVYVKYFSDALELAQFLPRVIDATNVHSISTLSSTKYK